MEYISPMIDVIFKKMFTQEENKDMLRGLVKAFLEVDIGNDFTIAGNELAPDNPDEKFSRIDLHASSDVGEIDIEVQIAADKNFVQRFTNYTMQLYNSSVKRGDKEYLPRPVMALGISSGSVIPQNQNSWVTEFKIMETREHFPLLDNFKMCFAELSKLKKGEIERLNDERVAWAVYFRSRREEEFNMLKENTTNPEVQKAINVLGYFSTDPDMQELARQRMNNEIYRQSALSAAYTDGKDDGIVEGIAIGKEEGIAIGKEEGIAIGEAKGKEEGRAELRAEIIAQMRACGMSEEQINNILNSGQ